MSVLLASFGLFLSEFVCIVLRHILLALFGEIIPTMFVVVVCVVWVRIA